MSQRHYRPEEVIAKLREAGALRGTFMPIHAADRNKCTPQGIRTPVPLARHNGFRGLGRSSVGSYRVRMNTVLSAENTALVPVRPGSPIRSGWFVTRMSPN
jgi:hypothetical protein